MPLRNIVVIAIATIVSLTCYNATTKSRYANLYAEALETVHKEALMEFDRRQLFEDSMRGLLSRFDRNSMFMFGRAYDSLEEDIRQKFGGVGLHMDFDLKEKALVVLAPLPDLPAAQAGMRPGDVIVSIDKVPIDPERPNMAFDLMRGDPNTDAEVVIRRGGELLNVKITRQMIPVTSVHGDWLNEESGWSFQLKEHPEIGYARITQFGEKTGEELANALAQINGQVKGLILDLRNDPGGLLPAAIDVCNLFLPPGQPIVETRGRDKQVREHYESSGNAVFPQDVPIVVLIDRNSASASEIVSACLQDNGRATIVGERSFGKGTVQNVITLERNRSALKLTTASFWRPSGANIDRASSIQADSSEWGVSPDPEGLVPQSALENAEMIRFRRLRDFAGIHGDFGFTIPDSWRIVQPFAKEEIGLYEREELDDADQPDPANEAVMAVDPNQAPSQATTILKKDPVVERAIELIHKSIKSKPVAQN